MSATGSRVGIVGVGNMGGRIARRLLAAGQDVAGHDLDPDRLAAAGIPVAPSLAQLVRGVDVLLLSLPDSSIIESVVLGEDGVVAHCGPGQVVVDLSTASPESSVRIHGELARREVAFLDAGISGGAKAAEAGTLTIMVGGAAGALDQVRPLLRRFSSRIFHMGPSGTGHVAKLLNNFLNGISLAATAEVMVAASKAGLDLERFLDVVNASSGANYATLNRFPSIVRGDYLEGGLTGKLMAKDILLYLEHIARLGVPSLVGPACLAAFELTNALGYGDQISNRVVDGLGDLAGGVRLHGRSAAQQGGGLEPMGLDGEGHVELVRSFFATLSSGDLDRVASFFDQDSTWTVCATGIPGAGTHRGTAIVEEFLRPVRGMFEPGQPKVEIRNLVAAGEWVAVEAVGRGRFRSGAEYENRYSFWVEVDGRAIRTIREYMDSHYVATLVP